MFLKEFQQGILGKVIVDEPKKYDDLNRTNNIKLIAGFDEAGRGPLCGPVVAAGVIMDPNFDNELINDSKNSPRKKRRML